MNPPLISSLLVIFCEGIRMKLKVGNIATLLSFKPGKDMIRVPASVASAVAQGK